MTVPALSNISSSRSRGTNDDNSVALVCEQTIPTERLPLSAKLVRTFADRGVLRCQRGGSLWP
jgi:hypothetical protein